MRIEWRDRAHFFAMAATVMRDWRIAKVWLLREAERALTPRSHVRPIAAESDGWIARPKLSQRTRRGPWTGGRVQSLGAGSTWIVPTKQLAVIGAPASVQWSSGAK